MKDSYFSRIRNPMTIIALFVGLTEIGLGLAVRASGGLQTYFVWFMLGFPSLIAIGFFFVLFFCPQNFYGPSDFRSDEIDLAINRRIESVEQFSKVIDEKIESMPLYRYPKLSECGKRLSLSFYSDRNGLGIRTNQQIIDDIKEQKFLALDIEVGLQELLNNVEFRIFSKKSLSDPHEAF